MAWRSVVTNAGAALMQQWLNSAYTMSITGAKGGTGTVEIEVLYQQTAMSGTTHTLNISRYKRTYHVMPFSILEAEVQVRPEASAYTLKQVGIFGKLMDGSTQVVGETLIAIYQAEAADEVDVPSISQMPDYVYEFEADLNINVDGEMTVIIAPDAPVSRADLADALATLVVRRIRTVETVLTTDWHSPGTTWTQDGTSFTAPAGLYACAIAIEGVRAVSAVMDSWMDSGTEYVISPIDYDTMDDGWMLLTSASVPIGTIGVGMMILI